VSQDLKLVAGERDKVYLETSLEVLGTFQACMNETLNALDDWEFSTRVGRTRQEVELTLSQLISELRAQ
jgi:hypothetical protein